MVYRAVPPPFPRVVRLGAALLAATAALVIADLSAGAGHVDLRRYESWLKRGPRVTLPGLWAGARVIADVRVRPLRPSGRASVKAGAAPVRLAAAARGPRDVQVEGLADLDGRLTLGASPRGSIAFGRVAFRQQGPRRIPAFRLLQYGLLVALAWGLGFALRGAPFGIGTALVTALLAAGAFVAGARVQLLVFLPWLLVLLALGILMAIASRGAGLLRPAAALVSLVFVARSALFLQPGFPSVDAGFHSSNVLRFEAGEVIRSTAPGPQGVDVAVPYPPALYALLTPFLPGPWPTPELPLRLALAVLEGSMPLLLFLVSRAAGASAPAASLGACVLATLPESVLVLGKGIAANALGQAVTLLVLLALARRSHALILAGLVALVFLSHLGAGLALVAFLCCWSAGRLLDRGGAWEVARAAACALAGVLLAWLVYYREVQALTATVLGQVGSGAVDQADAFFGVRWYRVGKTLQDLVLKLGLVPVGSAALGLRRVDLPAGLRALLLPWLLAGVGLGVVAILTPLPLRFEYFLGPAVSLAAGLGAEGLGRRGKALTLGIPLLLQAVLAAALWAGRFNLISVIMESPRWPFPIRF
jgi:hypothetical protein